MNDSTKTGTTQHTPGPWLIVDSYKKLTVCAAIDGVWEPVAVADLRAVRVAEAEANARLIAASPSLYAYAKSRAVAGDSEAIALIKTIDLS